MYVFLEVINSVYTTQEGAGFLPKSAKGCFAMREKKEETALVNADECFSAFLSNEGATGFLFYMALT